MNTEGMAQTIEEQDAAIEAEEAAGRTAIRAIFRMIAGASYLNPKLTLAGVIDLLPSGGGDLVTYLALELAEIGEGPAVWALSHIKANYVY